MIANSTYQYAPAVGTAAADAGLISSTLTAAGYDVTEADNVTTAFSPSVICICRFVGGCSSLFCVAAALIAAKTGAAMAALLAAASLICAYTTCKARNISSYMRIFAVELILFGALWLVEAANLWPRHWPSYDVPQILPLAVALFASAVYLTSFVPLIRSMRIADRYFDSRNVSSARFWRLPDDFVQAAERGALWRGTSAEHWCS